jgi:hypothetical protein
MTQDTIYLFASGDLRESANKACWPAQTKMESDLSAAVRRLGGKIERAHPVDPITGHGFLSSQRAGMDAFRKVPPDAPVIVAEAVWQYSHHVLPGLFRHRGPILTVANWSGQWPGLVGMLNLNGSLAKAGRAYSTTWSEDFTDSRFMAELECWMTSGHIAPDLSHVRPWDDAMLPPEDAALAERLASELREQQVILGVFDEGCMGMFNAIIPDELMMPIGVWKERLSQSALYHEARLISDDLARSTLEWFQSRGLRFHFGSDDASDLTEAQVLDQCRLYHAAARIAEDFGCEAIGIQYQQGLKDLMPASDLVEGTLNNADRPPAVARDGSEIRPGRPILHFNEVDECAGLDGVLIHRVHAALDLPLETTLHDLRWGDFAEVDGRNEFVWVFEISGAAPPAHHVGGWAGSDSLRQPPMYFPLGGGTLRGIAKPGAIVWSRIFVENGQLNIDLGTGRAVALSAAETERRRQGTTPEWPMMHAVLDGVTREQMMGRHKANHIQVVYAHDAETAARSLRVRAAMAASLGLKVNIVG